MHKIRKVTDWYNQENTTFGNFFKKYAHQVEAQGPPIPKPGTPPGAPKLRSQPASPPPPPPKKNPMQIAQERILPALKGIKEDLKNPKLSWNPYIPFPKGETGDLSTQKFVETYDSNGNPIGRYYLPSPVTIDAFSPSESLGEGEPFSPSSEATNLANSIITNLNLDPRSDKARNVLKKVTKLSESAFDIKSNGYNKTNLNFFISSFDEVKGLIETEPEGSPARNEIEIALNEKGLSLAKAYEAAKNILPEKSKNKDTESLWSSAFRNPFTVPSYNYELQGGSDKLKEISDKIRYVKSEYKKLMQDNPELSSNSDNREMTPERILSRELAEIATIEDDVKRARMRGSFGEEAFSSVHNTVGGIESLLSGEEQEENPLESSWKILLEKVSPEKSKEENEAILEAQDRYLKDLGVPGGLNEINVRFGKGIGENVKEQGDFDYLSHEKKKLRSKKYEMKSPVEIFLNEAVIPTYREGISGAMFPVVEKTVEMPGIQDTEKLIDIERAKDKYGPIITDIALDMSQQMWSDDSKNIAEDFDFQNDLKNVFDIMAGARVENGKINYNPPDILSKAKNSGLPKELVDEVAQIQKDIYEIKVEDGKRTISAKDWGTGYHDGEYTTYNLKNSMAFADSIPRLVEIAKKAKKGSEFKTFIEGVGPSGESLAESSKDLSEKFSSNNPASSLIKSLSQIESNLISINDLANTESANIYSEGEISKSKFRYLEESFTEEEIEKGLTPDTGKKFESFIKDTSNNFKNYLSELRNFNFLEMKEASFWSYPIKIAQFEEEAIEEVDQISEDDGFVPDKSKDFIMKTRFFPFIDGLSKYALSVNETVNNDNSLKLYIRNENVPFPTNQLVTLVNSKEMTYEIIEDALIDVIEIFDDIYSRIDMEGSLDVPEEEKNVSRAVTGLKDLQTEEIEQLRSITSSTLESLKAISSEIGAGATKGNIKPEIINIVKDMFINYNSGEGYVQQLQKMGAERFRDPARSLVDQIANIAMYFITPNYSELMIANRLNPLEQQQQEEKTASVKKFNLKKIASATNKKVFNMRNLRCQKTPPTQ